MKFTGSLLQLFPSTYVAILDGKREKKFFATFHTFFFEDFPNINQYFEILCLFQTQTSGFFNV